MNKILAVLKLGDVDLGSADQFASERIYDHPRLSYVSLSSTVTATDLLQVISRFEI